MGLTRMGTMLRTGGQLYLHDVVYSFEPGQYAVEIQGWIDRMARPEGEGFTAGVFEGHARDEYSTFGWILEAMLARTGFRIDRVQYSDKPCPGAEEIVLPEISTIERRVPAASSSSGSDRSQSGDEADAEDERSEPRRARRGGHQTITFYAPEHDQVFWALGGGSVSVSLNITPAMAQDQAVMLYYDGAPVEPEPSRSLAFVIPEVLRGTHTIRAALGQSSRIPGRH